jgi:predicted Zn-dependent peptidase
MLKRVKTRMLADWNNKLESFINRADTLARLQTLWGDANVVNQIPGWIDGVTSADLQRVAATYLTAANRTTIDRKPVAAPAAPVRATIRPPAESNADAGTKK